MQTKDTLILELQGCLSSSITCLLGDYEIILPQDRIHLLTRTTLCSATCSHLKQCNWARNGMSENAKLQTPAVTSWAFTVPSHVRKNRRISGSSEHGLRAIFFGRLLISNSSCIYSRFFKARTGEIVTQMDFACEVGMYADLLIPNRNLERK